jgi:hypothetical protein
VNYFKGVVPDRGAVKLKGKTILLTQITAKCRQIERQHGFQLFLMAACLLQI